MPGIIPGNAICLVRGRSVASTYFNRPVSDNDIVLYGFLITPVFVLIEPNYLYNLN